MNGKIIHLYTCVFFIPLLVVAWKPCPATAKEVIVYTAVDQLFSEPLLKRFEKQHHIRTKVVYDIEAVKGAGLVNRLIAERKIPRCDVFWNSEVLRTIMLQRQHILASYIPLAARDIEEQFKDPKGFWTGFAGRIRVIAVNTKLVNPENYPVSIDDLMAGPWQGKIAMANPLFGTTAMFVASLFSARGKTGGSNSLKALQKNNVRIVDGNAVVRDMVGAGSVAVGLTDMDDVVQGIKAGLPIKAIRPSGLANGALLIPNTVALVKGAPHPVEARELIEYLVSRSVEQDLINTGFAQVVLRKDNGKIPSGPWNYEDMADQLPCALNSAQILFVR